MSEVKDRPDSPGVWWREGEPYEYWAYPDGDRVSVMRIRRNLPIAEFHLEGRWLKADLTPPEFPQLPEKPKLCYGECEEIGPCWWRVQNDTAGDMSGYTKFAGKVKVIPHPDNDPEAVAAIERARQ